ncbi:MAG: hypothetical protein J6X44_09110 [Thermoguttaceae bacterium]|nr:hypothetical protein [Thermoguttaceae bacterium]
MSGGKKDKIKRNRGRKNKSRKNAGVNNEYRDRLFKFIFGNPNHKEWTLSLYNAVNGSNYTDENDIEINTIADAVYMRMKNDVSFLINDTLNLYEQQSTYNPNMPLRFLIYAGMLYDKYARQHDLHLYGPKLQPIPVPKCVCFYNGKVEKEDRTILKFTDGFPPDAESDVEITVTMINVNYGHNKELLESCEPLNEYSWFVGKVVEKEMRDKRSLARAIDETINEMPDDFVIKQFLLDNKAEVKRMYITEYDENRVLAQQLEDGIEIGREEGQFREKKATAKKLFNKGWTVEEIADFEEVDVVDVKIWLNENDD